MFPIVDEQGNITGAPHAENAIAEASSFICHPSSRFQFERILYLQKRPEWKDIQPGKWDTAVGDILTWAKA